MSPEQFKHYMMGDPKYDAEHYMLFQTINAYRALDNPTHEQADTALREIFEAFTNHVAEEEAYMEATDFPYLAYHREMHTSLLKQLQHYILHQHFHAALVKSELYDFSIAFAHHIDEADRQFYDLHKQ
jgi:hemerythrin-like metal-binding protein